MSKKTFYLVRHGETIGNYKKTHQEFSVALTKLGCKQAQDTAQKLSKLHIDIVITSDAQRAKETAGYIVSATGTDQITNKLFRELRRPSSVVGKHHFGFVSAVSSVLMFIHAADKNWHYLDGENVYEFRKRTQQAFEYLTKLEAQSIVVVSHRGVINAIKYYSKYDFKGSVYVFALYAVLGHLKNGSITSVMYDAEIHKNYNINGI